MLARRFVPMLFGLLSIATAACAVPPSDDSDPASSTDALSSFEFKVGVERANGARWKTTLERQRASVHFGNAYGLARLSQLAYEDENGFRAGLGALGLTGAEVVAFSNHCTGAAAYFVSKNGFAAVAFRGTEVGEYADIEADDPGLGPWRGAGEIGTGYDTQFTSIWNAAPSCGVKTGIATTLASRHDEELYVTGHSLGGALATLMVAETLVTPKTGIAVSALYTFGSPKVGDKAFGFELVAKAASAKTAMFRFVHKDDIVTGQPTIVSHDGIGTYFYRHFSASNEGEAAYQVYVDPKKYDVGEFVAHVLWSIPDHDIGDYAADIGAHARRRGEMR
jgi:hypothetical protein